MQVESVRITSVRLEDSSRLKELEDICLPVPWSIEAIENGLRHPLARYIACREYYEDGSSLIVGYLSSWILPGVEAQIGNVAVDPAYRRRGVAKKLLLTLIRLCEEVNVKDITLEVRPSNEAALALYSSLGFKEEGRRKAYYANNGEDAIIMWKRD